MKPRYYVTVWHGEAGSIGSIIDRKFGRVKGSASTFRNGADWRELLDIQCRALNVAVQRDELPGGSEGRAK